MRAFITACRSICRISEQMETRVQLAAAARMAEGHAGSRRVSAGHVSGAAPDWVTRGGRSHGGAGRRTQARRATWRRAGSHAGHMASPGRSHGVGRTWRPHRHRAADRPPPGEPRGHEATICKRGDSRIGRGIRAPRSPRKRALSRSGVTKSGDGDVWSGDKDQSL